MWLAGYPYLVSISDPWCSYSASYEWTKNIPVKEWQSFLGSKGIAGGEEKVLYSPPGSTPVRKTDRPVAGMHLTSEEIRLRFGLRSAFFTLTPAADSIVVSGRGYGHGVGLCQAARNIAEKKVTFKEIIGFYYPGTKITDIKNARMPVRP